MNRTAALGTIFITGYRAIGSVGVLAISLLLAGTVFAAYKQQFGPNDLAIRQVITTYIEATDDQQLSRLDSVLHPTYRTVWNRFYGDDVLVLTRRQYMDHVRKDDIGGVPRTVRFDRIEMVGTIALVKLTMESRGLTYTCFVSLIQDVAGRWWVVDDLPYLKRF